MNSHLLTRTGITPPLPRKSSLPHPQARTRVNRDRPDAGGPPLTNSLTQTTVLLVHGAPLLRLGLAELLRSAPEFTVCGETAAVPLARELFRRCEPDLVVLGLTLEGGDGLELIKDLRKLRPGARAVVLTMQRDPSAMQRAFRAGARGYVVARDDMSEILQAMREVMLGHRYASPSVSRLLLETWAEPRGRGWASCLSGLSDRELQVFRLLGSGLRVSKVATELHLSVKTIETHQMRMKQKLGANSAAELQARAENWLRATEGFRRGR